MTAFQAGALAESMVGTGYIGIVLDRVLNQVVSVLGVDAACLCVPDPAHRDGSIVAAARGLDDVVGARIPSASTLLADDSTAVPLTTVPGAVLVIGSREPNLRALAPLTEIVGAALGSVSQRTRLAPSVIRRVRDLAVSLDERDGYTADHSEEVVELVRSVAAGLGLEPAEMRELELAALLHDVGKIRVPDAILQKPGALDALEFDVMARHPVWGAQLLADVLGFGAVAGIVRYHHERWDGGGYPDGLAGAHIPVASRVISVCDAYHAMTSDRPYRAALGVEEAIARLEAGAGSQFDPDVVFHALAAISPASRMNSEATHI
jgi:HD-GYP domain-containing protein (c-di-GMP phosphodiesterase class II)